MYPVYDKLCKSCLVDLCEIGSTRVPMHGWFELKKQDAHQKGNAKLLKFLLGS